MDKRRRFKTQTEWVVQTLREAILSGEIKPGKKLRQEELAQLLGTSPTPVREAFRRLQAEGLIVHQPHKGVWAAKLTLEDIEEIYLIRSALEGLAARLAVTRLLPDELDELLERLNGLQQAMEERLAAGDHEQLAELHDEFHMAIYEAARAPRLIEMITPLRTLVPRYRSWVIPGRDASSMQEHREIVEAMRRRDAELTGQLVSQHIQQAMRGVLEYVQEAQSPSAPQPPEEGGDARQKTRGGDSANGTCP